MVHDINTVTNPCHSLHSFQIHCGIRAETDACQKLILKVKEQLKSKLETEAEEEVVRIKNVSNMHAKAITRKVLSL